MAVSSSSLPDDAATRVEDYLSDKIQTAADLQNVEDLLARVRQQQDLLKKQLVEAKSQLEDVQATSNSHVQALMDRTASFQQDQADIDRRLQILTQSEVSDDAARIFESRMSKLRRLDAATGYVEILQEVDSLIANAQTLLHTNPQAAIADHSRLRVLLNGLHAAQPAAEGAAPHLVDQVERKVDGLYEELKKSLESALQKTLEKMSWPKKELKLVDNLVQTWRDQVEKLLDLQEADIKSEQMDRSMSVVPVPVVLLPLQVMVRPLAQRFQYHFYGDRPTNRLDKPEYFFSHTLDLIDQHSPFMTQLLQPVLDGHVQKSEQSESLYTDAVSAFITALLPMVSTKCQSLLSQISSQPQLLSHFMHEVMEFDGTLRDSWAYAPVPGVFADWRGLTSEMLDTHGYFSTWLNTEKHFALSRYRKIRDAPESGNIDFDGVDSGRTKPTKGAIRVNDLLETITNRYRSLLSFSQKLKFLMEIQLSIFDDYHGHLYGALQAYLVGSHTAGRLIQGQTADDALGMKGLETLVKIFGSSEYLERKMSDWSDDVFFLELWDELQDRAHRNTQNNGSIGRDLHVDEVAARTSSSIKTTGEEEHDGGGLFDETAGSYRTLRERSEGEIVRALELNTRNATRPLTRVAIWSSLSGPYDPTILSPSSALDPLLNTLSTLLGYLSKVLAPAPLRRIARQVASSIQKDIYDNVVMRNSFSAAGAAQLRRDFVAIEEVMNSSTKVSLDAGQNMKKLEEALVLLNLPIKSSSRKSPDDEDGWGFDNDDDDDNNNDEGNKPTEHEAGLALERTNTNEEKVGGDWGLWDAEKDIFASNESARKALADMRLEVLTEIDARNIISKRVEINS